MTGPATTALAPGVKTTSPSGTTLSPIVTGSDRPDFLTPAYRRMAKRYAKCRLLMSGTDAVRDAGEDMLPRFEEEDDDDAYNERKARAALYNGFKRTVNASVGLLLQQEPTLGADMAQPLKDLWEDVDSAGTHGAVFARNLVLDGIVDGHDGILVDVGKADPANADPAAPVSAAVEAGKAVSSDDEVRLKLRPYFIQYKADEVLRCVYRTVRGAKTLVLLILSETVEEQVVDSLAYRVIVRYRIYRNVNGKVTVEIWQAPDGGNGIPQLVAESIITIANVKCIPWSPLRCGQKVSDNETQPPLEDLADLNIEHHQTKTNILNLETLAMVPTPVRIGAQPDKDGNYPPMVLGPRSTIEAPYIEGLAGQPVYWLSPDVDVLEQAQRTLDKTEAAMGAAGMAFLAPQTRSAETAQAREIDSRAQNATLAMIRRALQDCLEAAFGYAAEMMGIKGGSISLSNAYEQALMEPQAMMAYAKLVELGFPKHTALEALQIGGRIPADADLEQLELDWEAGLMAAQQQKMDELQAQQELMNARTGTKPPAKSGNEEPPPSDKPAPKPGEPGYTA